MVEEWVMENDAPCTPEAPSCEGHRTGMSWLLTCSHARPDSVEALTEAERWALRFAVASDFDEIGRDHHDTRHLFAAVERILAAHDAATRADERAKVLGEVERVVDLHDVDPDRYYMHIQVRELIDDLRDVLRTKDADR